MAKLLTESEIESRIEELSMQQKNTQDEINKLERQMNESGIKEDTRNIKKLIGKVFKRELRDGVVEYLIVRGVLKYKSNLQAFAEVRTIKLYPIMNSNRTIFGYEDDSYTYDYIINMWTVESSMEAMKKEMDLYIAKYLELKR